MRIAAISPPRPIRPTAIGVFDPPETVTDIRSVGTKKQTGTDLRIGPGFICYPLGVIRPGRLPRHPAPAASPGIADTHSRPAAMPQAVTAYFQRYSG